MFVLLKRVTLLSIVGIMLLSGVLNASAQDDPIQAHKDAIAAFVDAMNSRDMDALDDIFSPDYVDHTGPLGSSDRTLEVLKSSLAAQLAAIPDFEASITTIIADENYVAADIIQTGTFTEPLDLGNGSVLDPTQNPINIATLYIATFDEDGLISEGWSEFDRAGFLAAMGWINPVGPMGNFTAPPTVEPNPDGDTEANLAAFEALDPAVCSTEGDPSVLYADPYMSYSGGTVVERTPANDHANFEQFCAGIPDWTTSFEVLFAEGDMVAYRIVLSGTFTNGIDIMGTGVPLEPSGQPFVLAINVIDRFEDGKIVEEWTEEDSYTLLVQLGIIAAG